MQYTFVDSNTQAYNWPHLSHLTEEYLTQYGNGDVFVESGTYRGYTVELALKSSFKTIYSCELNDELHAYCSDLFKDNSNVHILKGDSVDVFEQVIANLKAPATFWLDAHASGPLVGGKSGGSPVLDELRLIKNHHIKEHTIFIDDRRLFGSAEWSFVKEEDALALIKEINPNYNIYYLDGHAPDDVICASVK